MESAEVTEKNPETLSPEQKKTNLFNDIVEILETMLMSVFVVLLLFTYLIRPVTVDGRSMVPTLQNQDKLVMRRILYQPHQGDVVVVSNYAGHLLDSNGNVVESGSALNEILIKRVIAVAGQTIEVREDEGRVYVDGQPLDEPYVNEPTLTNDGAFDYPITIPEGYIFVMGDNRNHSTDSRSSYVGLIAEEDVLGNAFFRYCSVQTDENGKESVSFSTVGFIG
ncbi:MAG: signal peptidase I [Oscillospiraceae bacterium]|nr:signal peptidase I [Oscillospiraceae bacterium]